MRTEEFKNQTDLAKERFKSLDGKKRADLGLQDIRDEVSKRIAYLRGRHEELEDLTELEQEELVALERKRKPQVLQ